MLISLFSKVNMFKLSFNNIILIISVFAKKINYVKRIVILYAVLLLNKAWVCMDVLIAVITLNIITQSKSVTVIIFNFL